MSNISFVTRPTRRMVRSTDLPGTMPLTPMGASPDLGTDTSKNWPGFTSPENAILNVYPFLAWRTTSSTLEGNGT